MILQISANPSTGMSIATRGKFYGDPSIFFRTLMLLTKFPCLWGSVGIEVTVNFQGEFVAFVVRDNPNVGTSIPLRVFLETDHASLVREYMRPFASSLAEFYELPTVASRIRDGQCTDLSECINEELDVGTVSDFAVVDLQLKYLLDEREESWLSKRVSK